MALLIHPDRYKIHFYTLVATSESNLQYFYVRVSQKHLSLSLVFLWEHLSHIILSILFTVIHKLYFRVWYLRKPRGDLLCYYFKPLNIV